MNMSDVLVFLRIANTIVAFAITVLSLKKSNENPLFKHIANLTAMLGFWVFIRLFVCVHSAFGIVFILLRTIILYASISPFVPQANGDYTCNNLYP